MTLTEIFRQADELRVSLSIDADSIIYRPKSAAPPDFVDALKANKPAIIQGIQHQSDVDLESRYQRDGYVLCYAGFLDDFVVYHRDDVDVSWIPYIVIGRILPPSNWLSARLLLAALLTLAILAPERP